MEPRLVKEYSGSDACRRPDHGRFHAFRFHPRRAQPAVAGRRPAVPCGAGELHRSG